MRPVRRSRAPRTRSRVRERTRGCTERRTDATANHLRRLREAGLVRARRHGRLTISARRARAARDLLDAQRPARPSRRRREESLRQPRRATTTSPAGSAWDCSSTCSPVGALIGREGEGESSRRDRVCGVRAAGVEIRTLRRAGCARTRAWTASSAARTSAESSERCSRDSLERARVDRPAGRPRRLTLTPAGRSGLRRLGGCASSRLDG